jgi:hypothetical protein
VGKTEKDLRSRHPAGKVGKPFEEKASSAERPGAARREQEAAAGSPGERRTLLPALSRRPYPLKKYRQSPLESVGDRPKRSSRNAAFSCFSLSSANPCRSNLY